MCEIITIASGKGGVGKSTVISLLAAALSKQNKKVLLTDMDQGMRTLDLMLGVSKNTVFDLYDIMTGNCTLEAAIHKTNGFDFIPAPLLLEHAVTQEQMSELLLKIKPNYDYILLDCPAGIESNFRIVTSICDKTLITVTPDSISVRDGFFVGRILKKQNICSRLIINKWNKKLVKKSIYKNIDEIIDETAVQLIAVIPEDKEVKICGAKGILAEKGKTYEAVIRLSKRLNGEEIPIVI